MLKIIRGSFKNFASLKHLNFKYREKIETILRMFHKLVFPLDSHCGFECGKILETKFTKRGISHNQIKSQHIFLPCFSTKNILDLVWILENEFVFWIFSPLFE